MRKCTPILTLSIFLFFFATLSACAKTTEPFNGVTRTTPVTTVQNWQDPLPQDFWKGDEEKAWAQVKRADGKLVWVSFQNAPARPEEKAKAKIKKGTPVCSATQDVNFSVAWRTDKDSHPGESDEEYGHVGTRCYGNKGQCPPTAGEAWQNVLRLINQPTPPIPASWKPDQVYGDWLGSCN